MKKLPSKILLLEVAGNMLLIPGKKPDPSPLSATHFFGGKGVSNFSFSYFSQKQRVISKNIIRHELFYIKFATKNVLINFFVARNETELQSFQV